MMPFMIKNHPENPEESDFKTPSPSTFCSPMWGSELWTARGVDGIPLQVSWFDLFCQIVGRLHDPFHGRALPGYQRHEPGFGPAVDHQNDLFAAGRNFRQLAQPGSRIGNGYLHEFRIMLASFRVVGRLESDL
jgi:hypothetical protein